MNDNVAPLLLDVSISNCLTNLKGGDITILCSHLGSAAPPKNISNRRFKDTMTLHRQLVGLAASGVMSGIRGVRLDLGRQTLCLHFQKLELQFIKF